MSKVSAHLEKVHSHLAEHHSNLAECFGKLADFGKSAKSEMEGGKDLTDCLGKIATQHTATAAFHKAMASECTKAAEASDLEKNQLVPTEVSAVTPDTPRNIRAVPRHGAKPFPAQTHAVPLGGIDFSKIIGVRDEDLNEL
jgi:hypothetical protein